LANQPDLIQHHLQRKRNSQYHNDRQHIIEIIRERDEYPYYFEISQNSKGEAQLTAKIRMEKLDSGAAKTFDYL